MHDRCAQTANTSQVETPASRAAALQMLRLEVEALGLDAKSLSEPFLMRFLRARNFNTTAAGRILCRYLVRRPSTLAASAQPPASSAAAVSPVHTYSDMLIRNNGAVLLLCADGPLMPTPRLFTQERRKLSPALFNATAKDVWSVFAQCGVGVLPVRSQQTPSLPESTLCPRHVVC
jgi:hypothetical protein